MFRALRNPGQGRRLIIDENMFIEKILPSGMLRRLSAEEYTEYRHPYRDPVDRLPLWRWPQEIPIEGQPRKVHDLVMANQKALKVSTAPKLLCFANPGAVIKADQVTWCRDNLSHLTCVDLGDGIHFLPEDHPHAIGDAISDWLDSFDHE